ncbi:hypothetical protein [Neobacillus vireti]|uniref:hypothetical protein n=1 Tax=Neobacillus vireti TaxID=220686 RepID=UPI002FFFEF46
MKKVFLIIGILVGLIVLSPFLLLGVYALDFVYYGANEPKAEKAALEYLKEKYGGQFEIDDVEYTKILGDDEGDFTLQIHPLANAEMTITVNVSENYQVTEDNYKEENWGEQFKKEMLPPVAAIFQDAGKIYAYGSFPEEIGEKYRFEDSYQTIYNENPLQSFERIHVVNFAEPFEKEKELQKIYELWELVKDRQFKNNNIEINYYPKELYGKLAASPSDINQFENEYRDKMFYFCRFSHEEEHEKTVTSPEDIEGFCRELK